MTIPPLPLLDGDTLLIDNSRLERYTRCPREGQYAILHRRIPDSERSAVSFGGALHAALELRYRHVGAEAPTPETEARQMMLLEAWWANKPTPLGDHRTLGLAMKVIRDYNRFYGAEPFELLEVEGRHVVEEPFAVPLGTVNYVKQQEGGGYLLYPPIKVVWTGRIDLPICQSEEVFVMDHKSSSIGGDYFLTEFSMSSALMGYCWALQQRYGLDVRGAVVNALVVRKPGKTEKAKDPVEFLRQKFYFDQDRLAEWAKNTLTIVQDMVNDHARGYFPLHQKSCVHKYGRCDYMDVCTLSPGARDLYLNSEQYRNDDWSPLHGKAADIQHFLDLPADQLHFKPAEVVQKQTINIDELINL